MGVPLEVSSVNAEIFFSLHSDNPLWKPCGRRCWILIDLEESEVDSNVQNIFFLSEWQ
jgi:hypothetical protein